MDFSADGSQLVIASSELEPGVSRLVIMGNLKGGAPTIENVVIAQRNSLRIRSAFMRDSGDLLVACNVSDDTGYNTKSRIKRLHLNPGGTVEPLWD